MIGPLVALFVLAVLFAYARSLPEVPETRAAVVVIEVDVDALIQGLEALAETIRAVPRAMPTVAEAMAGLAEAQRSLHDPGRSIDVSEGDR